jgi:hypothetical protein
MASRRLFWIRSRQERLPYPGLNVSRARRGQGNLFRSRRCFDTRLCRWTRPAPDLEGCYFFFPFFWEDDFWTRWASGESFKKMAK